MHHYAFTAGRVGRTTLSSARAALIVMAVAVAPGIAASPAVIIGDAEIRVTGIEPRGSAIIVGFGRSASKGGGIAVRVTKKVVSDDDGDGEVAIVPGYAVPLRSVWVAVDYATGRYAIAGPAGSPFQTHELRTDRLRRDDAGGNAFLRQARARTALVLVRPGAGAWYHLGVLGGTGDAKKDENNGELTLAFADGVSLITTRPDKGPRHVRPGDVLIAIDPGHLEVFATAVTE